jgi:hypothetical protein
MGKAQKRTGRDDGLLRVVRRIGQVHTFYDLGDMVQHQRVDGCAGDDVKGVVHRAIPLICRGHGYCMLIRSMDWSVRQSYTSDTTASGEEGRWQQSALANHLPTAPYCAVTVFISRYLRLVEQ